MHELAVTESLLNTASDYGEKNQADKITVLNIVIGSLSGIVDESVQFYWDIITADTLCDGSKLKFRKIPAKFNCQACGNDYELANELTPCPKCGSMDIRIIQGDEFLLESIEIEKSDK